MSGPARDKAIDVMRGIAIIMVFIVHYGQSFGTPPVTEFGMMGCQLFFFVSGYVCCLSFQRCKDVYSFIRKRYLAIAPAFCLALTVIVIANYLHRAASGEPFVGAGNTGLVSVLCNYALIHGLMPFCYNNVFPGGWFVGTLIILYLFHPCVMDTLSVIKKKWVLTVAVMISGALISVLANYMLTGSVVIENDNFAYYLFTNQICCYWLGILCYLIKDNLKPVKNGTAAFLSLVLLLITVLVFYSSCEFKYVLIPPLMGFHAFFLFIVLDRVKLRGRVVDCLTVLGKNSFYIYLVHMVVAWTAAEYLRDVFMRKCYDDITVAMFALLLPCVLLTLILVVCFKYIIKFLKSLLSKAVE